MLDDLIYSETELFIFQIIIAIAFIVYLHFKDKGWW
jgi:hypothetical protein